MDIPVLSNLLKLQLGKLQMCCFFFLGLALVVAWPIVFMSILGIWGGHGVPLNQKFSGLFPVRSVYTQKAYVLNSPRHFGHWSISCAHPWNLKANFCGLVDANKTHVCVSRCNWGTACVRIQIFESTLAKSTNGYVIAEVGMWLCAIYQVFQFIQVFTVFYQNSFIFVHTLFMHEKHLSICLRWYHLKRFPFGWGWRSILIYSYNL